MEKYLHIAVAHLSLNFRGGAERLCLTMIEALKHAGYETTLMTVEKTNWRSLKRTMGSVVFPDHEVYFTDIQLSKQLSLPIIVLLFVTFAIELLQLKLKRKYDLVINTYGDLFTFMCDVVYVHFPLKASLEYSQTPPIMSAFKWRVSSQIYNLVCRLFDKIDHSIILVNSMFTQELVKRFMHRKSIVVYPPVDTKDFSARAQNQKRTNTIVTISRYSPKRHLENIPLIAQHTNSTDFVIMGNADETSVGTIQNLSKLIDDLGLKRKMKLLTNVSRSTLLNTLSTSKVYLHVMPQEHFGISVVEAMANGCIPVVHRSGGPWLDVLNQRQGKYGYAYDSPLEAAKIIETIVNNEAIRKRVSSLALKRSAMYDKTIFQRRVVKIVKPLCFQRS